MYAAIILIFVSIMVFTVLIAVLICMYSAEDGNYYILKLNYINRYINIHTYLYIYIYIYIFI